jgi:FtsZ-binding cell division protein ZapB|tara:strand:- start:77 stop:682 length:606 start_codon:yes stop_codon:yes gene_type:complete
METNIYYLELIQFKVQVLKEIRNNLSNIVNLKIRSNLKAYKELEALIYNFDLEINELKEKFNAFESDNNVSVLKIETNILKKLFLLRQDINVDTTAELLNFLIKNYTELFLVDKLIEVIPLKLEKELELELNKTDFYICMKNKNIKEKILYKLDDLIIYDDVEYLDFNEFSEISFGNNIIYASSRFTLEEINTFIKIWKKF